MFAVDLIESKPEFYMNSSTVSNNLQHGLFVENVRNYVIVNSSSVTYNGYGAGIRIYSGAGKKTFLYFTLIALQYFVPCIPFDTYNM